MTFDVKCPVCAVGQLKAVQNGGGVIMFECAACDTLVRREALEEWLSKQPKPVPPGGQLDKSHIKSYMPA